MKTQEKPEARRLRIEEQLSIKAIAARLSVAKSTVSLWVRDLPLSDEVLQQKQLVGATRGGKTRYDDARAIRREYQQAGREMAVSLEDDPLFVAGCMMHWAEGAKSRNTVNISNTSPHFLRLWLRFIQRFFNVDPKDIALHIHCYLNNGKTQQQIERHWLKQLDLPRSCLRKTTVVTKHRFSTFAKKNKHPYGVARLRTGSTEVVQKIWGAIKLLADIYEEDQWLD